ncbi:hypothetical protein HY641_02590 [Candidatus Woesearchaeota archaeon]|nr:hypothetical protein [Candidatus Woesearchaeota archaeon]
MQGTDFTIARCKDRAGFSAKPAKNVQLDLQKIGKQFTTILKTPILLVIDEEGEIIVHQYGELLFKSQVDKGRLELSARRIYTAGGLEPGECTFG